MAFVAFKVKNCLCLENKSNKIKQTQFFKSLFLSFYLHSGTNFVNIKISLKIDKAEKKGTLNTEEV